MHKIVAVAGLFATAIAAASDAGNEHEPASMLTAWFENYYPYGQRVAGLIDNTARGIDSFFGNDDAWRVDNKSWLRVTNDIRWDDEHGWNTEARARLKIDVPTASKRLRLLIENDAPEERTAVQEAVPSVRNIDNERKTVLGLGADMKNFAPDWKKQFQVGLHVEAPLEPYTRFIARRRWQLDQSWELNSYNRAAWFGNDGYSWKSELKIGEPLAPRWRIDYATDLSWRENRDYLHFAESANLTQILSSRSAITYTAGFSGSSFSEPRINAYFLVGEYRHNLFRRIVFASVLPELSFPREYDFDPHWAITLRLELYFQREVGAD